MDSEKAVSSIKNAQKYFADPSLAANLVFLNQILNFSPI